MIFFRKRKAAALDPDAKEPKASPETSSPAKPQETSDPRQESALSDRDGPGPNNPVSRDSGPAAHGFDPGLVSKKALRLRLMVGFVILACLLGAMAGLWVLSSDDRQDQSFLTLLRSRAEELSPPNLSLLALHAIKHAQELPLIGNSEPSEKARSVFEKHYTNAIIAVRNQAQKNIDDLLCDRLNCKRDTYWAVDKMPPNPNADRKKPVVGELLKQELPKNIDLDSTCSTAEVKLLIGDSSADADSSNDEDAKNWVQQSEICRRVVEANLRGSLDAISRLGKKPADDFLKRVQSFLDADNHDHAVTSEKNANLRAAEVNQQILGNRLVCSLARGMSAGYFEKISSTGLVSNQAQAVAFLAVGIGLAECKLDLDSPRQYFSLADLIEENKRLSSEGPLNDATLRACASAANRFKDSFVDLKDQAGSSVSTPLGDDWERCKKGLPSAVWTVIAFYFNLQDVPEPDNDSGDGTGSTDGSPGEGQETRVQEIGDVIKTGSNNRTGYRLLVSGGDRLVLLHPYDTGFRREFSWSSMKTDFGKRLKRPRITDIASLQDVTLHGEGMKKTVRLLLTFNEWANRRGEQQVYVVENTRKFPSVDWLMTDTIR